MIQWGIINVDIERNIEGVKQGKQKRGQGKVEDWDTIAAAAKSLQSCLTLCSPIDSSPPGSLAPGILQARTLEWVAIFFSNSWKWKWSRSVVSDSSKPHGLQPTRLLRPWDFRTAIKKRYHSWWDHFPADVHFHVFQCFAIFTNISAPDIFMQMLLTWEDLFLWFKTLCLCLEISDLSSRYSN